MVILRLLFRVRVASFVSSSSSVVARWAAEARALPGMHRDHLSGNRGSK